MDLSAGHQSGLPFKDVPWKIQLLVSIGLHVALFGLATVWWSNNDHIIPPLRKVIDVELITRAHLAEEPPSTPQVKVKAVKDVPKPPEDQPAPVARSKAVERPKAETKPAPTATNETVETRQSEEFSESTSAELVVGEAEKEPGTTRKAVEGSSRNDVIDFDEAVRAYQIQVKELIEREKRYPLTARKGRQQGKVTLVFQLNKRGTLIASSVAGSSGYRLLDRAALKAVRAVGQFPALPTELSEETLFQVDLQFTLK